MAAGESRRIARQLLNDLEVHARRPLGQRHVDSGGQTTESRRPQAEETQDLAPVQVIRIRSG